MKENMNAAETLARYERQLAALDRMERILGRMTAAADQMAGAVQRAADRMGELLASTQKTAAQSLNLKAPFDGAAQSIAGAMVKGLDKLKDNLPPRHWPSPWPSTWAGSSSATTS